MRSPTGANAAPLIAHGCGETSPVGVSKKRKNVMAVTAFRRDGARHRRLSHFEGRSWQGLHRHVLMTMIAYALGAAL
jgi:hypothetical protein